MKGETGKGTGKSELTGFGTGLVLLISKSRSSHLWKHMVSANGILCPENSFPVRHPVFSQTSVPNNHQGVRQWSRQKKGGLWIFMFGSKWGYSINYGTNIVQEWKSSAG
jgi:hypothetical protein